MSMYVYILAFTDIIWCYGFFALFFFFFFFTVVLPPLL